MPEPKDPINPTIDMHDWDDNPVRPREIPEEPEEEMEDEEFDPYLGYPPEDIDMF